MKNTPQAVIRNSHGKTFPKATGETVVAAQRRSGDVLDPKSPADIALNWHTKHAILDGTEVPISGLSSIEYPLEEEIMDPKKRTVKKYILKGILIVISCGGPNGMSLSVDVSFTNPKDKTSRHIGFDRMEWGKPTSQEEAQRLNHGLMLNELDDFRRLKPGQRRYRNHD